MTSPLWAGRLACLLILALASIARGQYGPPADGRPVPMPGPMSAQAYLLGRGLADPDSINPLSILAGAAETVQRATARGSGGRSSNASESQGLSGAMSIMLVLTVITLVPSILLMCTCFVRILVVLALLRQALGTQSLPPPQVLLALSLFVTLLVMSPTIDRVYKEAVVPYQAGEVTSLDALWERGKQPLRDFMFNQIEAAGNWSSVYMMLDYRGIDTSDPARLTRADVDMVSLIPAFMLSELKTAFLMGFRVYLPFLVIDMVISTMLISMSMMMLPPIMISLPFKLLLFVLVDGWALVVGSLMRSVVQEPVATHASLWPALQPALHPVLAAVGAA